MMLYAASLIILPAATEFSNTPFIKHRPQAFERDDYRSGMGSRQNFGSRNNNSTIVIAAIVQAAGSSDNRRPERNRNNLMVTAITATQAYKKRFK